jgi:hypothetical protein
LKNKTFDFLLGVSINAYYQKEIIYLDDNYKFFGSSEKLYSILAFNGLRPAAFSVFNKSESAPLDLVKKLKEYNLNQITKNLNNKILTRDLIYELNKRDNKSIPYKGQLFNLFLFPKNEIRESGDIDLLIHPDCIVKAFSFLLDSGYDFSWVNEKDIKSNERGELIKKILFAEGKYEITLYKKNDFLDLHWGLSYGFLPYKVPYNEMFQNLRAHDFYGKTVNIPSTETLLWMIILHHGGKELWVRQKHWLDLLSFYEKFENQIDWGDFLQKAKQYNLYKISLCGFYIISKYFGVKLNDVLKNAVSIISQNDIEKIIQYMTNAQEWSTLVPRFKYEKLLISLQDNGFSKWQYFKNIYKEYSKPNPLEHGRIIEFNEKYYFLNFISKIFSYLIKKSK